MMMRARIIHRSTWVKFTLFPLHISISVLLLLRQRRGAAATTWATRLSTWENNERRRGHRPRRTRPIQRSEREKILFSAAHQKICFSPAATA
jgi:hypothetical protein